MCWDAVKYQGGSFRYSRTTSVHSRRILCIPVLLPAGKYMVIWFREDWGPTSLGRQCQDIIHVSFAHNAALIVYQERITQSTAGGCVSVQKMGKEVSTNCAVNAIISGLHIERHQGHQQERLVCFCHAVGCLSTHFQGQQWKCTTEARRWKTIFSIGHQLLFFSQWRMRGSRERESVMTFKIHGGETLPSGASRSLPPEDDIMQFCCSLTVSREDLSASFLAWLWLNMNKEVFSVTNRHSEQIFCASRSKL